MQKIEENRVKKSNKVDTLETGMEEKRVKYSNKADALGTGMEEKRVQTSNKPDALGTGKALSLWASLSGIQNRANDRNAANPRDNDEEEGWKTIRKKGFHFLDLIVLNWGRMPTKLPTNSKP
jgi:hypothetical protein